MKRLLQTSKYELIPIKNAQQAARHLPQASVVSVACSWRRGLQATLDLSAWLRDQGHQVTPHLAAGVVRDRDHLRDAVSFLSDRGISRAFVVGGDKHLGGAFADSLALLEGLTDINSAVGTPIKSLGIAGYPTGHASIPDPVLAQSLHAKQTYADSVTTQICLDHRRLHEWLQAIRQEGVCELPVYVGVPGRIQVTKLMQICEDINVMEPVNFLRTNTGLTVSSLLKGLVAGGGAVFEPETIVRSVVEQAESDLNLNVVGFHFYTFNHVESTVGWVRRLMDS